MKYPFFSKPTGRVPAPCSVNHISPDQARQHYQQLTAKVDDKFAEIRAAYPDAFACRSGCHSCCLPGLSVSAIEADHIRHYLDSQPALREHAKEDPYRGTRCCYLDRNGACSIYPARPLICRSHGAPIKAQMSPRELPKSDCCPLNFTEDTLDSLPEASFINIDTLNTLLALLNKAFDPEGSEGRTALLDL